MKYDRMIEKENNRLKLEDKKFEHSKEMGSFDQVGG
jgi:hypothetical protein